MKAAFAHRPGQPAVTRLSNLARLDDAAIASLETAIHAPRTTLPNRDLVSAGTAMGGVRLLVDGWAAKVRVLRDGRRQLMSLLLPGDLYGYHSHAGAVVPATIVALTKVVDCAAPSAGEHPTLSEAYDVSRALDDAYTLSQVVRLGRLPAQERIASLLIELHDRLALAGLAAKQEFACPLTQEVLADVLGLTGVHINRMLQLLRRQQAVNWTSGIVGFGSLPGLKRMCDYQEVVVRR